MTYILPHLRYGALVHLNIEADGELHEKEKYTKHHRI